MTVEERLYSFSSANTFPMKILLNPEIVNCALEQNIIPSIHLQLNPTNKCNFNCLMCSCSERVKYLQLDLGDIDHIIEVMYRYGLKSVTITGGGEPLMHPEINEIIRMFHKKNVKIGIVTNGSLLNVLSTFDKITWIRISASDYMKEQYKKIDYTVNNMLYNLAHIISSSKLGYNVDWSFSYVLSKEPDYHLIRKLVEFANKHNFTHFRLVNDIFIADELVEQMKSVKQYLKYSHYSVDDSLVNYQDRSEWTSGYNPCYISLLKPVIGADGYIYPCCGTQYALKEPTMDYGESMRMGHIKDLEDVLLNKWFFDGSECVKCYYGNYNRVLKVLIQGLKHREFV